MNGGDEIFAEISAPMIKGLMIHDQMASYYAFLNLKGYSKCHEYHFWEENKNYLCLKHYYLKRHGKLIREKPIENPQIIPSSWYDYLNENVDINTKRNSVKTGLEKWIKWETETRDLYSKYYTNLISLGYISDADFINDFIEDVECELAYAKSYYIEKQDCDFSINSIIDDQKIKKEKYEKKMRGIEE